jgi:hypothetical protein
MPWPSGFGTTQRQCSSDVGRLGATTGSTLQWLVGGRAGQRRRQLKESHVAR